MHSTLCEATAAQARTNRMTDNFVYKFFIEKAITVAPCIQP